MLSLDGRSREVWTDAYSQAQRQQTVVYLHFFLVLLERELGASLKVRSGTVKSRLRGASRRLRGAIVRGFPDLAEEMEGQA